MNPVPAALQQAYARARYRLQIDGNWCEFRVGTKDAALDTALRGAGCRRHWHYLTPFNPGSIAVCPLGDSTLLERCAAQIAARGWTHVPACSENDDGDWHEPGFVVFDAEPSAIKAYGRELGQRALVFVLLGAAPQLVWL